MTVINRQRDALKTKITLRDFGKAMAAADLSTVPPEKRKAAIMDALATIMQHTVVDPDAAISIAKSQKLHRQRHLGTSNTEIIIRP